MYSRVLAAFGLGLVGVVASAAPPTVPSNGTEQRFEFTRVEMAMPVRIVLYGEKQEAASGAAAAAFDRFRELNGVLSDYNPESELRKLCRTAGSGHCMPVSNDLWRVLEHSIEVSQASDGAFDVTIGPVSRLWRRARRRGVLPSPDLLALAMQRVDYRLLKLDPVNQCVMLMKDGMTLDLGGIGKGYAIDEALRVLREHGFERAMVDASGDIGVGAAPPGMPGWRIAIAAPDPKDPPEAFLWLTHATVAHSGDAWQYVEIDGTRYSHIIDPKTGLGLTDGLAATVIAPDALAADALASAVSVLGPERGLALIERTPGVAARLVHVVEGRVVRMESAEWKRLNFAPDPEET